MYSVWRADPDDDRLVALDEPARRCAELMGVELHSFRMMLCPSIKQKKWHIVKEGYMKESDKRV